MTALVYTECISILYLYLQVQDAFISLCGWRLHKEDSISEVTRQLVAMIQDANIAQLINESK